MSTQPAAASALRFADLRTWTWPGAAAVVAFMLFAVWHWGLVPVQRANFGDGQEYLTMTTSFMRHGGPRYKPGDDTRTLRALPRIWRKTLTHKITPGSPPAGYYASRDGKWYSYHFFTYSAVAVPLRVLTEKRPDAHRAHQYTNLIVFSIALASLLQLAPRPRLFWSLAPLAFFTPVLWFTPFASTEAFVFSLGLLSLTSWLADRPILAIFFSAVAATQYQPLALLTLFLCGQWLWSERGRLRGQPLRVAAALASSALVFAPSVFYYAHFGTANLIAQVGLADARFMSFQKFVWLFLDPNGGMIAFTPGLLLLLLLAAGTAVARLRRERDGWGLALFACVLLTMLGSTVQRNWNHPTWGVSRYVLYSIAPVLLFVGVELRRVKLDPRLLAALVVVVLGLQLLVHRTYGYFIYTGQQADHHMPMAVWVLERWPGLYSPPPEIFCERTVLKCSPPDPMTGLPRPEYLPAIWRDSRGRARKILAARCELDRVLGAATWSETERAKIRAAFEGCSGSGVFYITL